MPIANDHTFNRYDITLSLHATVDVLTHACNILRMQIYIIEGHGLN